MLRALPPQVTRQSCIDVCRSMSRPNLLSFPLAAFEYAPWILYTNVKMNQQYHDVI